MTNKQRIRLATFANTLSPNYNRIARPVLVAKSTTIATGPLTQIEPYSKIARTPGKRIAITEQEILALRLAAFVAGV